jgi:hypothetical protein
MFPFLLNPQRSGWIFATMIMIGYCVLPLWYYATTGINNGFLELASITAVAALSIIVAFQGRFFNTSGQRLEISVDGFVAAIWIPFLLLAALITLTAPAVPLVTALSGGSPDLIALQREEFLKGREGIEASFVYLNAFFTGALIPYSISLMFVHRHKWRWTLTIIFLVYSICFVEKAFFFKLAVPLFYLFATGAVKSRFGPKTTAAFAALVLVFIATISGAGSNNSAVQTEADFFSASYAPTNPVSHLVWRAVAVPMFTAADAIRVFVDYFGGEPFYGATSGFLSALFGLKRIMFERVLFEVQWGQNEAGTGSSNSMYVTEAFINFSWIGVVVFSLFVGRSLKWFSNSKDEAFRSTWPLYVIGLYSAGLVGQLLSNGFLLLLIIGLLVEVKQKDAKYPSFK